MKRLVFSLTLCAFASAFADSIDSDWRQWGGANRNFKVAVGKLADHWPEEGPHKIWQRKLGEGYSAVVKDDGLLFTLYRNLDGENREYTVALDASTGETIWEHGIPSKFDGPVNLSDWGGDGPNSTPLVAGDRLFSITSKAVLLCFEKRTGKLFWKHDLLEEYKGGTNDSPSFSPSPIAYKKMIIVPLGHDTGSRTGYTLIAFDQASGREVWKALEYRHRFSSPIMIHFQGQDQLILSTDDGLLGVDPECGDLLWRHPVAGSIVSPVWNGKDIIFYSSGGDAAVGLAVQLKQRGEEFEADQIWINEEDVIIWQSTPVHFDGHIFGATTKEFICVDIMSGACLWKQDGLAMATSICGDGKLILYDADGYLALATVSSGGFNLLARCRISCQKFAFTVPALADTVLYVRDRQNITALDLSMESE